MILAHNERGDGGEAKLSNRDIKCIAEGGAQPGNQTGHSSLRKRSANTDSSDRAGRDGDDETGSDTFNDQR